MQASYKLKDFPEMVLEIKKSSSSYDSNLNEKIKSIHKCANNTGKELYRFKKVGFAVGLAVGVFLGATCGLSGFLATQMIMVNSGYTEVLE